MKKCLILWMSVVLVFGLSTALGESITRQAYTDIPNPATQDSVLDVETSAGAAITVDRPDEDSARVLNDAFSFVYDEGNRPVRYYDEATQESIQELVPTLDIDSLHMSEFMKLNIGEPEEGASEIIVSIKIDVDYQPGQTVIAVLGVAYGENDAIQWHSFRCDISEPGMIMFLIPAEEFSTLSGQSALLTILTNRVMNRGGTWSVERQDIPIVSPSITVHDIRYIRSFYSPEEIVFEDNFTVRLSNDTDIITQEMQNIRDYLERGEKPFSYFSQRLQEDMAMLLGHQADIQDLMVYEIVSVEAREYKDTYGDVAVLMELPTIFPAGHSMIAMIGFPSDDPQDGTLMDWACLQATAMPDGVEFIFQQLIIPRMEKETAMLILLSVPLPENEE